MMRATPFLLVAVVTLHFGARPATAIPIKGVIKLPAKTAKPGSGYLLKAAGFWLLPNDVLDVLPSLVDPRAEMVVALEGRDLIGATLVKPVVRIEDARFNPAVLAISPHTKVTIENRDGVAHNLEAVSSKFMASQRIDPKGSLAQVFDTPGSYSFRCTLVPHMRGVIFVVGAPLFVQPDNNGTFTFPDIRPGTYTLKVWHRDKWIHSQPLVVKQPLKSVDVQLPELPAPE